MKLFLSSQWPSMYAKLKSLLSRIGIKCSILVNLQFNRREADFLNGYLLGLARLFLLHKQFTQVNSKYRLMSTLA